MEHVFFHEYLGVRSGISVVAQAYQGILTLGYRPPEPQNCTIVTLRAPDFRESVCATRDRLREAVKKLLRYKPHAIVVAVTLQSGVECCKKETDALVRTVRAACQPTLPDEVATPIVFGHDFQYQGLVAIGIAGESIVPEGESKCGIGHTSPEKDFRLAPLEAKAGTQWYPSLSWRAAQLVRPDLEHVQRIADALSMHKSLYTSLFSEKEFGKYSVTEEELFATDGRNRAADRILGRVAVVGFEAERPAETNIGPVSPHVLHAAYIEAFLSGRLLRGVPDGIVWILALAFWISIAYVERTRGLSVAFYWLTGGFVMLLILTPLVLVRVFSMYSDFPTIGLAGLFIWTSTLLSRIGHRH
jgi:hypothetical protein